MDCEKQHSLWLDQVQKLKSSLSVLTSTDPMNILQHFFLQALQQRSANIIKSLGLYTPILNHIRLSDLRNKAVFDVYRQCGIHVDTYFERYSSPPGTVDENECYSRIAHGDARATATQTVHLSNVLNWMQILKRFFLVYDSLTVEQDFNKTNLNWIGAMWKGRIEQRSLGDLVWELFLDLWYIEN